MKLFHTTRRSFFWKKAAADSVPPYQSWLTLAYEQGLTRLVSSKLIIPATVGAYGFLMFLKARKEQEHKYALALSRKISRMSGRLGNMPLPPYLRQYFFLGFGKMIGVNLEEMLEKDLDKFRTFNEFFSREIDMKHR